MPPVLERCCLYQNVKHGIHWCALPSACSRHPRTTLKMDCAFGREKPASVIICQSYSVFNQTYVNQLKLKLF